MARYFLQKFIGLVPLFFGITLVSFLVVHLAPGTVVHVTGWMRILAPQSTPLKVSVPRLVPGASVPLKRSM